MNLSDPSHPVWSFARTLIVLAVFGVLMFAQARQPDWTEGKLLIQATVTFLIAQAGHEAWKKYRRDRDT